MCTKGAIHEDCALHIDQYTLWECLYLYNEVVDFLWDDSLANIHKLTLKPSWKFFEGQPPTWHWQALESLNAHNNIYKLTEAELTSCFVEEQLPT